MAWRGSFSRSLISTARASTFRPSPAIPRLRPPPVPAPRHRPRGIPFANPRTMGEMACVQSLIPLAGARLTSHSAVKVRACCELSHGTFHRTCQDR